MTTIEEEYTSLLKKQISRNPLSVPTNEAKEFNRELSAENEQMQGTGADLTEIVEQNRKAHSLSTPILETLPDTPPISLLQSTATALKPTSTKSAQVVEILKNLKPRWRTQAIKLLANLQKHQDIISWDADGKLWFGHIPSTLNLSGVLPLTFYGLRKHRFTGPAAQWFSVLRELQLEKFIKRDKPKSDESSSAKKKAAPESAAVSTSLLYESSESSSKVPWYYLD